MTTITSKNTAMRLPVDEAQLTVASIPARLQRPHPRGPVAQPARVLPADGLINPPRPTHGGKPR